MKIASQALKDLLASGNFVQADLYTITLNSGQVWRMTSGDADIQYAGNTYASTPLKRGGLTEKTGLEVATLEISIYADGNALGLDYMRDLTGGLLDAARVVMETAIMSQYGDTTPGTVKRFFGVVADVSFGRTETAITVKSDAQILDTNLPRNVYQAACLHTLFDAGCGLSSAALEVTGAISGTSTRMQLATNLTAAAGYFDQGSVRFTSGKNAGLSYTVKGHLTGGVLDMLRPTLYTPAVGDAFVALPGCDKSQATCTSKYNNLAAFRGYPFVPPPETPY